jgi:hypothetical protein
MWRISKRFKQRMIKLTNLDNLEIQDYQLKDLIKISIQQLKFKSIMIMFLRYQWKSPDSINLISIVCPRLILAATLLLKAQYNSKDLRSLQLKLILAVDSQILLQFQLHPNL